MPMKSADEIKKGLECCVIGPSAHQPKCGECPYKFEIACSDELLKDTATLVQQLEAERDAAVKDLTLYAMCAACKHGADERDAKCPYKNDCMYATKGHFEWRGVQKEG